MTDAPRKPFWKRKRWIAAAVLWVVVANQLSFGPAVYCIHRGWFSARLVFSLHLQLLPDSVGEASGLWDYNRWWDDLGRLHGGRPPANR